MEDYILADDL